MDSKFEHELEKIRNNESGERIRYQIEFEQNMETKLTVAFLSWRRLHAVRMHTRRSLDRHDYTHSIDLSALHIHLDVHCLFCLFIDKS